MSISWKAREARFDLAFFGLRIFREYARREHRDSFFVLRYVLETAIGWFAQPPMYWYSNLSYGKLTLKELEKMLQFYLYLKETRLVSTIQLLESEGLKTVFPGNYDGERGILVLIKVELQDAQQLLLALLESELNRFATWMSPLQPTGLSQMPDPVIERVVFLY
jgi:hypothetical protein